MTKTLLRRLSRLESAPRHRLGVWVCVAGLAVACVGPAPDPARPAGEVAASGRARNVVLISVDTLRPDFLGAYDPMRAGTPAIDRLAATGVVFEDALAQGASTAISHKSILYSLYPAVHKTTIRTVPAETIVSPVEALTAAGWRTAAFVDGGQLNPKYGIGRGFELYDSHGDGERELGELAAVAEAWIDEHRSEPFFLLLHTYQVHAPYDPPAEFRERFASWYEGDLDPLGKQGKNFYNRVELGAEDLRFIRSLYEAEVAYADQFVGRVLDTLETRGIAEETIVVLLSDHGESLGEGGHVGHNRLEGVQLRIPIIARIPGIESMRVEAPVESIDVMPTLFAALGVEAPYPFQGVDLMPALTGATQLPTDRVRIAQQGLRVVVETSEWRWRFDLEGKMPERLYRIGPDGSMTKESIRERWPDGGRRLKQTFRDMVRDAEPLAAAFHVDAGLDPTVDDELRDQLTALGYLQ